jgi:hypothetical protein
LIGTSEQTQLVIQPLVNLEDIFAIQQKAPTERARRGVIEGQ